MTVPMAVLSLLAVAAIVVAGWACYRESDARSRARRRAEVWEWRALRLRRESPFAPVDERARLAAMRTRPLTAAEEAQFRTAWRQTKLRFADDPGRGLIEADDLIADLAYTRGVPAWTLEHDSATPLAWRYPELEQHYRMAHRIASLQHRGAASLAELEEAMRAFAVISERLLEQRENQRVG